MKLYIVQEFFENRCSKDHPLIKDVEGKLVIVFAKNGKPKLTKCNNMLTTSRIIHNICLDKEYAISLVKGKQSWGWYEVESTDDIVLDDQTILKGLNSKTEESII